MVVGIQATGTKIPSRMKLHKLNQDDVMSEYEMMKPYFEEDSNDFIASCSPTSAAPNEDIWKKFELLPTPPRSPEHSGDDEQYDLDSMKIVPLLDSLMDESVDCVDCAEKSCKNLNKPSTPCTDCQINQSKSNLIKDCMWNGVGHRPMSENKNKWKNLSAQTNHPSGCVDPKSVFPGTTNEVASTVKITKKTTAHVFSEKSDINTSDTDEEIDVVTVTEKPKLNSAVTPRAIVGTLVTSQNKLSFIKSNAQPAKKNGSAAIVIPAKSKPDVPYRGRTRCKFNGNVLKTSQSSTTVTMLIDGSNDLSKAVKVQLKTLKTAAPVGAGIKRCNSDVVANISNTENISRSSVMRLATPGCVANGRLNTSTSPASRTGKKRILSLDGVSFSATISNRQYQNTYNYKTPKSYKKKNATFCDKVPELKSIKQEFTSANKVQIVSEPSAIVNSQYSVPVNKLQNREQNLEEVLTKRRLCESAPTSPLSFKRKRKNEINVSGSSSSSENEQTTRAAHNVLERQRREGLRTSFHTLRNVVPELIAQERTPKVNILTKARDYCMELRSLQSNLVEEKKTLQDRNAKLQQRLQQLQNISITLNPSAFFEEEMSEMDGSEDETLTPESSVPSSPSSYDSSDTLEMCKGSQNSGLLENIKNNYCNYSNQSERFRTTSNSSDLQSLLQNIIKSSSENTASWQTSRSSDEEEFEDVKSFKENFDPAFVAPTIL